MTQGKPHRFSATEDPRLVHLRVLATTDLHVHIRPYDYYADRPDDRVGLARTIALARHAMTEADNAVLVDNGDFLQGNPMGDFYGPNPRRRRAGIHPAIAAMNAAGYDAACLGNHEFNYGLPFLAATLAPARFPVVTANVATRLGATPAQDDTLVRPFAILDRSVTDRGGNRRTLRIGILGLVPPQVALWDRTLLDGAIAVRDMVETAAAIVPRMRAAGADIVIALCHGGIGSADHEPGAENAAIAVARVPGIDTIVTGHTHGVFPSPAFTGRDQVDPARGTIGGKPAVMAGLRGSHLGVIDLLLRHDPGGWQVADHDSTARPISGPAAPMRPIRPDPAIIAATALHHRRTLRHIRRPIGATTGDLHSYFSLVAPDAALALVMAAQRAFAEAQLAGRPEADLPILSAAAPFKCGGLAGPGHFTHVAAGPMTYRHASDLYAFPNSVRLLVIDGGMLRDWLEQAAGVYRRIQPGLTDQPLLDPGFPSYSFDVISGVTYRIDPSQPRRFSPHGIAENPASSRIADLRHHGRPVTPTDRFVIVTNNYRVDTGAFAAVTRATPVAVPPVAVQDLLVRHIRRLGTIHPMNDPIWRFAGLPGTSALFETSPQALQFLPSLRGQALEPAGLTPSGFARLRIRF